MDWLKQKLQELSSSKYNSYLEPHEEFLFRKWIEKNKVPFELDKNTTDYDMRGYFKDYLNNNEIKPEINTNDNQLHFTDKFKTPLHQTFSNESIYNDSNFPKWKGNTLVNKDNETQYIELPEPLLKRYKK